MVARGHDCFIVASATDKSGMGGRVVFTSNSILPSGSEFGGLHGIPIDMLARFAY